jgi:ubiquinone biosynthesis monooxygenase Coq7
MYLLRKFESMRVLNGVDLLLMQVQTGLQLVFGPNPSTRPRPGAELPEPSLSPEEKKHIAGLMRINHSGEVCAQALYFGQALMAKDPRISAALQDAALEEIDHLRWCEERITELGSHTSVLNPLWYACSVLIGICASLKGDAFSLGFIHATEAQVEQHLASHWVQIPEYDHKTRAVIAQMKIDEAEHGAHALDAGGQRFSDASQATMTQVSRIMTTLSYY